MITYGALSLRLIVLASLLFIATTSCRTGFDDEWQYEPGIIIPNGGRMHATKNLSGIILSQPAGLRVSRAEVSDCSAFHALILPDASDLYAKGLFNDRWHTKNTLTTQWQSPTNASLVELNLFYDGKSKKLTIGGQSFSTVTTNLFLIRLHSDGTTDTQPLNGFVNEDIEPSALLVKIKSITDDPAIHDIELGG